LGRVRSSDPDVMIYRSGGGCLAVFGLPFLLIGLSVMAAPFLASSGKAAPPWYGAVPFGAVFATVGAALVFGRSGTILDRRGGSVTTWWGLLVPFRRTVRPLADFQSVVIAREVRRSKNSTYTVYPVRLTAQGTPHVEVQEPRDEHAARSVGEELARFLGVRLVDHSMGATVVREADQLDESLRDRVQRGGERLDVGEPPPDARSRRSVAGDALVFELPPTGFKAGHIIAMVVGLIIPAGVFSGILARLVSAGKALGGPELLLLGVVALLFVGVPFLAFFATAVRHALRRSRVEVSPRELRVTQPGILGSRTKAIPTDQLEELEVVGLKALTGQRAAPAFLTSGDAIVARSDRLTIVFGAGLSRAELDWMRAVIWNVVTA